MEWKVLGIERKLNQTGDRKVRAVLSDTAFIRRKASIIAPVSCFDGVNV